MNKKSILLTMLFACFLFGGNLLLAQTFTGNNGSLIPGTTDGYYCENAAVSTVNIPMPGRIGVHFEIERVSIGVTHEFPAEMQLSLISPRGNIINLSIGNGGSLDNAYANTDFRDGGNDISNSITPFNSAAGYEPQGNTFADQFLNEKIAGDWQLEICDLANNANGGVINDFSITLNQIAPPSPEPVYDIQVSSTSFINVNLDGSCQQMLIPSMILNGNFDLDGDGNTPPDNAYFIQVNDANPCNGPIIDGCGNFEVWVSAADTMPQLEEGFDGCSMENILSFNSVPNPASGQLADVEVAADTITLTTLGGNQVGLPVTAGVAYTFSRPGTAGFRFNFENAPLGIFDFDVVRVSFDGTETPIPVTTFPVNGTFTFAQPIEVEPGDQLRIELRNEDGASEAGDLPSIARIFDFFFLPVVSDVTVNGPLPLGTFVFAADATPASFITVPTQSGTLFSSQVADVLVSGLPSNVSRSYRINGQTGAIINNSLDPIVLNRLNLAGGLPTVFDGCSEVDIMIVDQITSAGNCVDVVATRTFVAQDDPTCIGTEGSDNAVLATQTIVFSRPSLANVMAPPAVVEIDCNDFNGSGNPAPIINNYPTLQTANGPIFLDQSVDNIGVTFTDGPRINTCDDTYKFIRTFSVVDWCDIDTLAVFNQLVKVGDFSAPSITPPTQDLDFDGVPDVGPLVFSTNALNCTAFFDVSSGVMLSDDCSDAASLNLSGFIYLDSDLDNFPLGPFGADDFAANVPPGEHLLRYVASDLCGNADTLDVQIRVADLNAPTAICEDGLNVSLSGSGLAELMAVDVNAASIDDCSGTDLLYEIAFVDEDNNVLSPWMPSLILTCNDIGTLRVGMRVTDDGNMDGIFTPGVDNSNQCFAIIMVEDQTNPVCIAPASRTLACADLEGDFPDDLNAAFAADPEETTTLLDATFGAANGVDNCPGLNITQTVVDNRTACGAGIIFRTFGVTDAQGFTALPNCNQTIQIAGSFNYSIAFPADEASVNCAEPDFDDVMIVDGSCDMITMGTTIDTFEASGNGCYLLRIRYEVLNMCEYSTTSPAYEIPRDADDDNIVGEAVVLHVTPGVNNANIADDVAILDRDLNRANGNSIANLDTGNGGLLPGSNAAGYGQDGSRGFFTYTQFITVNDNLAPSVSISGDEPVAMDTDGDCAADLDVDFSVIEACNMNDVTILVDVDLFINDANDDGDLSLNEFVPTYDVPFSTVQDLGGGNFRAMLEDLPMGEHAIRVRASDGCGNSEGQVLVFTGQDGTASSPVCINGLTATLSADEMGGGIAQVPVSSFVVNTNTTDCSGPLMFAIYRIEEANVPGFTPDPNDTLLTVNCADLGSIGVRIYAIDNGGMSDFCETSLLVQVFNETICDPDDGPNDLNGVIAGSITTPGLENQEGVEVNITAQAMGEFITFTNFNGNYAFQNLMLGDDYTIEPTANPAVNLGHVTTGDLILISRHILALQEFDEPYQYVAADVNADHSINILDLIAIRRVILGLDDDYPACDSWAFVSVAHDFGVNPDNWLDDQLMMVHNINNLSEAMLSANFMAIEMGNVSDASTESNFAGTSAGQRSLASLSLPLLQVQAHRYFEVQIPRPADLLGFQTTLELDADLELIGIDYGSATAEDFNLTHAENGLIGIAYVDHRNGAEQTDESDLFTLRLRAQRDGQLDELLQLSDRLVTTEAYVNDGGLPAVTELELDFEVAKPTINSQVTALPDAFRLEQNRPNPFREATAIDYFLPVAGPVKLMVHDQQGRTILLRELAGMQGLNTLELQRTDLGEVSGLLTYTLSGEAGTISRKMLLVR